LSSPSADTAGRHLRRTLLEHGAAIVIVGTILAGLAAVLNHSENSTRQSVDPRIAEFLQIEGMDWSSPLHRELFRDTYRLLTHARDEQIDSLLREIERVRLAELTDPSHKLGGERRSLSWASLRGLVPMYIAFVFVFVVVLAVTYVAARAAAIRKFVLSKQGKTSYLRRYRDAVAAGGVRGAFLRSDLLIKAFVHGAASFLLFSPAYVVAYSLRTRLDTENVFFLVVLAVLTNGVLVHYAGRLYALLVAESRKGYVETALVKGVHGRYSWDHRDGLPHMVVATPLQSAKGHVFHEIYRNASLQFIPSMKEHVTFIVTGLVIIEMALNIKGHLCYALLQHILYREYDIAIAIVFLIFLAVKAVEMCIDAWHVGEMRKYENAG
jgi:hypothetical protein